MADFSALPSQYAEELPLPRLRLTAAKSWVSTRANTRSRPLRMSESHAPMQGLGAGSHLKVPVNREKTCTAMMPAPGAIPVNGSVASSPAAIPATWVPWLQSAWLHGTADPAPVCVSRPLGHVPAAVSAPSTLPLA
jgi:hypothetical protein